jgi:tripartite-type tricarboxylate transporter receptor subunit TctC
MPARTPDPIVATMNRAINKALQNADLRASLSKIGGKAVGGTSADFADFLALQVKAWDKTVKDAGIKLKN